MNDCSPLISILLPTKNPGRFLKTRLDSIFGQTISDWELIIVDSQSTDGSLAILKDLVQKDRRVTFYQRPPGLYQAWNYAIEQARGKYVYIATADDTMTPEALEKMSNALDAHPDCDLCDTLLQLIDADGNVIPEFADSYVAHCWHFAYPRNKMHVRKCPADFFAHLGGKTIYTSITQVLIRRSLFNRTGLFPENYGPSADYMWGMRAALHTNVIFLPEHLASWRIHASQVTFATTREKVDQNYFLMRQMAQDVLRETSSEIATVGRKIVHLSTFKGILLPAKNPRSSIWTKWFSLGKAFVCTPLLMLEFLCTIPLYVRRIPRSFLFIYTYDQMIRRRAKKFYRGMIIELGQRQDIRN